MTVGDNIKTKIIKIDPQTKKISVGVKQLTENPYDKYAHKYEIGSIHSGVVNKVMDYGCFVRLDDGIEGLVHSSEVFFQTSKKGQHIGKVLSTSQRVKIFILDKDDTKKRFSFSYKRAMESPWKKIKEGSIVESVISNITEFAIFSTIKDLGLTAMTHKNDISYVEEECDLTKFKKNSTIKAKVLECNESKEKIRLGIAQLGVDPFDIIKERKIKKGDVVTVAVKEVLKTGIRVTLGEKLTVLIKKSELSERPADCRPEIFSRGNKTDAMCTEVNISRRRLSLSIKEYETKLSAEAVRKFGSEDSGASLPFTTKIGEILGKSLKKKKKK